MPGSVFLIAPTAGREIRRQTVDEMCDQIMALGDGTKLQILAPVVRGKKGEHQKTLDRAKRAGYVRARIDGSQYEITEEEIKLDKNIKHSIEIIVDRIVVSRRQREPQEKTYGFHRECPSAG